MKKTIVCLSYISVLCLSIFFLQKARAATTATVTATVTYQSVSVTVSDGVVAYGTLAASGSRSTIASEANDQQTATNNGNVAEDLNIKGTNTAAWTLAGSAGSEQYVHKFCITSCGTPPTNYTALTTDYQTLGTDIALSGTKVFDLQITVPSSTSTYTQQNADITVQAVAH